MTAKMWIHADEPVFSVRLNPEFCPAGIGPAVVVPVWGFQFLGRRHHLLHTGEQFSVGVNKSGRWLKNV